MSELDALSTALANEFKGAEFTQDPTGGLQGFEMIPEQKEEENALPGSTEKKEEKTATANIDNSSLNTEKTESKTEKVETPIQRSLDELLSEKTEGKFKAWEEIEKLLSEPKEDFADERVKQINQFVKEGGKFDANWLYWATTDFTTMQDDPIELLAMEMRLKDPNITDKEIEYELKREYRMDEWAEEGEEPTEIEQIMSDRIMRKSTYALAAIQEHQKKLQISPAKEREAELKAQEAQAAKAKQNWEANVSTALKDLNSLPVKLSDTNTVAYELTPELKGEVQKTMNALWTNPNALLENFVTKDGIDAKGLAETIVKLKNFDKIVAIAVKNAQNVGKKEVVDKLKNTDFAPESKQTILGNKTYEQQIGEQVARQLTQQ